LLNLDFEKGITELNEILNSIKSKVEVDELHLLGGDQPKEVVLKQFENENFQNLKLLNNQTELISYYQMQSGIFLVMLKVCSSRTVGWRYSSCCL
jgi:hypothetical protein